jgi:hypothetical protein
MRHSLPNAPNILSLLLFIKQIRKQIRLQPSINLPE